MDIIYWIVFGLIIGVIANMIDPRPSSGGIGGAIMLGIVGAIIGGFLGQTFLGVGVTGFNLVSIVISVAGSLVALFIGRKLIRG